MHSTTTLWGLQKFTDEGLLLRIQAPADVQNDYPPYDPDYLELIIPLTSENFDTAFVEPVPNSLRPFAVESAYHAIRMLSALTMSTGFPVDNKAPFKKFLYDWAVTANMAGRWESISEFYEFVIALEERVQPHLAGQKIVSLPTGEDSVIIVLAHKFGVATPQEELYILAGDGRWKTFGCARTLEPSDIIAWTNVKILMDDTFTPKGLLGEEVVDSRGLFTVDDLCLRDLHEELDIARKVSARIADGESEPLSDVAERLGLEMPEV